MRLSQEGRQFIKSYESLRLGAYMPTPDDVPTIGWGHTGHDVFMGKTISIDEAKALFDADIAFFEDGVTRLVRVPIEQNQFDALVSFAMNVGLKGFADSTLLRLLNGGQPLEAAVEFLRWDKQAGKKLRGLTSRRESEMNFFIGDTLSRNA